MAPSPISFRSQPKCHFICKGFPDHLIKDNLLPPNREREIPPNKERELLSILSSALFFSQHLFPPGCIIYFYLIFFLPHLEYESMGAGTLYCLLLCPQHLKADAAFSRHSVTVCVE